MGGQGQGEAEHAQEAGHRYKPAVFRRRSDNIASYWLGSPAGTYCHARCGTGLRESVRERPARLQLELAAEQKYLLISEKQLSN